jgi:hypothetical protein
MYIAGCSWGIGWVVGMEAIPWCVCTVVVMQPQMQALRVGIRGLFQGKHLCKSAQMRPVEALLGTCVDRDGPFFFVRIYSCGRMFDGDAALPHGWWLPLTGC